jgi:DUF971 family protein
MSPTNLRALRDDRVLEITWPDGVVHRLPFRLLRQECPCASCVNEFTGERMLKPDSVSEDIAPESMNLVGNYALKISWSDGHNTGLYAWEVLRRIAIENGLA